MREIPADIKARAEHLAVTVFNADTTLFNQLAFKIASLLADERERCAKHLDEAARLKRESAATADNDRDHTVLIRTAHNLEYEAASIRRGGL